MRLITCVGFTDSGSGAAGDLYAECSGVQNISSGEFRFLQDPNGVSDLEYYLVENNHRQNSGYAIKEFIRYIKLLSSPWYMRWYQDAFQGQFYRISMDYVDSITELKAKSWWHGDQIQKGRVFNLFDRLSTRAIRTVLRTGHPGFPGSWLQLFEQNYYTSITQEKFLDATRAYLNRLFSVAAGGDAEYVLVDQMIPPTNTKRFIRYFDDVRAIVVDRDPRDLYIFEKYIQRCGYIPYETVEEFVKWFQITREAAWRERGTEDSKHVLRIRLEDMIFHYDEMEKKLLDFAGLPQGAHRAAKTLFDPQVSVQNTNLKQKYPQYAEELAYIEKQLSAYLYDFDKARSIG